MSNTIIALILSDVLLNRTTVTCGAGCCSSGMRECNEGIVTLESVDGATFKHILDYIYKGNLDGVDDLECIADIYMAADMFQMTDLLEEVLTETK